MKGAKIIDEVLQRAGVAIEDVFMAPSTFFMNLNLEEILLIADGFLKYPESFRNPEDEKSEIYYDIALLAKKYREQALDNLVHFQETSIAFTCKEYFKRNHIDLKSPQGEEDFKILKGICLKKREHFLRKDQPLKIFIQEALFATFFRECLDDFRELQGEKILKIAKVG